MWFFIRIALKFLLGFLRNVLFVAVAAALACVVYFVLADVVYTAYEVTRISNGVPYQYILALLPSVHDYLPMIGLGYALAAPGLFFIYFPIAWRMWVRQRGPLAFVVAATAVASCYAVLLVFIFCHWLFPGLNLNDVVWLGLTSFTGVGLFTGLFHYRLLVGWRNREAWQERLHGVYENLARGFLLRQR